MAPARNSRWRSLTLALILTFVAGLAVTSSASADNIFAATSDNRLKMLDTSVPNGGWTDIGQANNVTAMTASDTTRRLWVTTSDNGLYVRESVRHAIWRRVGHANRVVALASVNGTLYAVTSDDVLWSRPEVEYDVNWTMLGSAQGVTSMTGFDNRLWATTSSNGLFVRPAVSAYTGAWTNIGHAYSVVGLTTVSGSLVAAVANHTLHYRPAIASPMGWGFWQNSAVGVVDLASTP